MEHFTCPKGHRWEVAANGTGSAGGGTRYCPVCGAPHMTIVITGPRGPSPEGAAPVSPPGDGQPVRVGTSSVLIPGYELLGELGRGGMGVVFKARQADADRFVAVKMILAGAYAGPAQLQRFRNEAEAAARLHHPNIVKLYEVGEHEGRPYFLLEFVSGSSLAQQLDGTPWPARQAAELIRVLALAMNVAHQLGIVHRDLKPGNVLLTEDGVPKITDFGLAKILDHSKGPTQSGDLLGTPCYIAPEQADRQNRPITPAVDVYALGAILYELLTGRPPFRGETPLDTVLQVLNEEPVPVSRLQPKVPRELETVCLKCLEKEPRRRYGSAQELADELTRFLQHQPVRARPPGAAARLWRWCRRNPSLAVTGALALALLQATVVLSVWFGVSQSRHADQLQNALTAQRREIALRDFTQGRGLCESGEAAAGLLFMSRGLIQPAPDDVLERALRTNLWTWGRTLHPLRAVVAAASDAKHAVFSADGQTLATANWGAAVSTWDEDTQDWHLASLLQDVEVSALALSADGTTAATVRQEREEYVVEVWDVASAKRRGPPLAHDGAVLVLVLSPSGRLLLTEGPGQPARLWDARGGRLLGALPHAGALALAVFNPDESRLLTADAQGKVFLWNVATRQTLAEFVHGDDVTSALFDPQNPGRVFTGSKSGIVRLWEEDTPAEPKRVVRHNQLVRSLAVSPNGAMLFTASDDHTARAWNIESGLPLTDPLQHRGPVHSLGVDPEGRTLLTVSADQTVRLWDATTGAAVGAPIQQQNAVVAASFASQGRMVLTASESGLLRAWQVTPAPSPRQAFEHPTWVYAADLSGDGKLLLAGTEQNGAWLWSTVTGEPLAKLRPEKPTVPAAFLSPDGSLAALAVDGERLQLWEVPGGTAARAVLEHSEPVVTATFSPDGRKLLTATVKQLYVWDVRSGKREGQTLTWPPGVQAAAFSADATRAALAVWIYRSEVWDLPRGVQVGPTLTHAGRPTTVASSRDGTRVAVGTDDRTARVWLPAAGQPLGPPLRHAGPLKGLALSPDGRTVLTATEDARVYLWDPVLGQPLGPPLTLREPVVGAGFSPDGESYHTTTEDQTVRLWAMPRPLAGEVARVVLTIEVHTGMSLEGSDVLHVLDPERWEQRRQKLQALGGPLLP